MTDDKNSNVIKLPNYDLEQQEKWIKDFIKPSGLSFKRIKSFIYADFLFAVSKGLSENLTAEQIFSSYLASVQKTCDEFMNLIVKGQQNAASEKKL